MSDNKQVTPEEHKRQIGAYTKEKKHHYDRYADVLKKVLEKGCGVAVPEAIIQARSKSVASFAEKCVRRFASYPDAINQLTDLCGARVIVQTLDQVSAVRQFIKANFEIVEEDEKGSDLAENIFAYRDLHFIVQLNPDRCDILGISPEDRKIIGERRAEIQVRTWVEHAWADTLHDRMYKTRLKYPAEFKRVAALLSALMEDGDRTFNRLALDIDGMLANYNAYASRDDVEKEIKVQELILENADPAKKAQICLNLARLIAAQGEYPRIVKILQPYADVEAPLRIEILLELGYATCREHQLSPTSKAYRQGQAYLQEVIDYCEARDLAFVPNLRKHRSHHARALARLAWSYRAVAGAAHQARSNYQAALELEPSNPYYLADVIGYEIHCSSGADFVSSMSASIRTAIDTCRMHVVNGTEMPYACFTAGRLHLLLGESDEALGFYARGIHHVLACTSCIPPDILDIEKNWLLLVTEPRPLSGGCRWAMDLLELGERSTATATKTESGPADICAPVLIVAGGAMTLKPEQADGLRPMLVEAFTGFDGTILSGGTRVGVPGCVGDAAEQVGPRGSRPFTLIGYLPRVRPGDAPKDERYDRCVECGEAAFTAEQILRNWTDILEVGIDPQDVQLLGFGGGPLSAVEYRIALGLGAKVGLVMDSGGSADELLQDQLWATAPNLLPLPLDPASVRALAHPPQTDLDDSTLEKMGMAFHVEYVRNSANKLPGAMKPWAKLDNTFKTANLEQAKYTVQILEACGFEVRPAKDPANPLIFSDFETEEIEKMAELEHGRWNEERLRNGWRPGTPRDDKKKIHDCLIPWAILPDGEDGVKKYDRSSVRMFPEILAQAGLEIDRADPLASQG